MGDIVEIARKVILGGADILQLRAKAASDEQILKIGQAIKDVARKNKVPFVLNDRADLAQDIDADGVHLGQEDLSTGIDPPNSFKGGVLSVKEARRILGNNKIIGLSTHNLEQAVEAEGQGADYIGLGPIFATATKPNAAPLSPEIIAKVKDKIKIPFVAIGGINLDNLEQVLAQGAQRVAVCSAIITAKGILSTTKEFKLRLTKNGPVRTS